jgi:hypothetical protein
MPHLRLSAQFHFNNPVLSDISNKQFIIGGNAIIKYLFLSKQNGSTSSETSTAFSKIDELLNFEDIELYQSIENIENDKNQLIENLKYLESCYKDIISDIVIISSYYPTLAHVLTILDKNYHSLFPKLLSFIDTVKNSSLIQSISTPLPLTKSNDGMNIILSTKTISKEQLQSIDHDWMSTGLVIFC